MDELLEGFDVSLEAYPEYLGSLAYIASEWPRFFQIYVPLALLVLLLLLWLSSRRPLTYWRTLSLVGLISLATMPGALGNGGLVFVPLAAAIAVGAAMLEPGILLYNVGFLLWSTLIAVVLSIPVHLILKRLSRDET